jgi:DNA primase small subunit
VIFMPEEKTAEEKFLRELFSRYYENCKLNVVRPKEREFGFGGWEKKIEFRHIAVEGEGGLRARLVKDAPLYVSHSVAYYEFPEARPMPKKNWLGADLVFDLDAPAHTCGKFTCQSCLDGVKADAIKLIEEFLVPEFGFSTSELSVNFSGSRGYHVHVRSEAVMGLDREARREIADYVGAVGLSFDKLFWEEGKKLQGPTPAQGGYGGKFARAFAKKLSDDGFASSISRKLKKNEERAKLVSAISSGNWDNIGISDRVRKLSEKFEGMKLSMAGRIDSNVTSDTTKLIRMPDSIHGGSGFLAKTIGVAGLASFEPMDGAQVFTKGEMRVKSAEEVPALRVGGAEFGPLGKGKEVGLPQSAAVYLLCKKAAVLA